MRQIAVIIFFLLIKNGLLVAQNLVTSNLPIVVINTNGITIPDEPKLVAHMGIINNPGQINNINDPFNEYDGKIGIETRGSSTQMFEKKSYGIELRDENGADMDTTLLGMPSEEDWILYGPYMDKSLLRNVVTFTLDGALGHYSPRCRYVEMVLNNEYVGLYVLMEKIKRDKNRVDIAKLKMDDNEGEELTGGYIIKIDKTTGEGGDGFYSDFANKNNMYSLYQYEYPKPFEITGEQKEYISDYVHSFENAIYNNDFTLESGYRRYIDINSFVDYQIINELSRNVDAYRLSTFYYKDKNERLNIGPVWDFNLGYGNANYYTAWSEQGFQFLTDIGEDYWQNPFYWEQFKKDPFYCNRIIERWQELRENVLSNERVFYVVDSLTSLIAAASGRNFQKWNILGQYVWPNYYIGPSWQAEVNWMKNWLSTRLDWLDGNIISYFSGENPDPGFFTGNIVEIGPNPFTDKLKFYINSGFKYTAELNIYSGTGTKVISLQIPLDSGLNTYDFNQSSKLSQGVYYYQLIKDDEVIASGKMVKTF
ncbi:MAG: CotH kinase family protein [Prolixibacteraceae bacterium]|nr:CotH kinase family protein [Prolixibacteraceae bacterium]